MSDTTEHRTSHLAKPICPHCGHCVDDDTLHDLFTDTDEDVEGYECCGCEGRFAISKHISVRYSTTKESKP